MTVRTPAAVRPATPADAEEVVRLAALMYAAMGVDADVPGWDRAVHAALHERLGRDVAVFVVDAPDGAPGAGGAGGLAACGASTTAQRLPGPSNLTAAVAYLQWISSDPRWRRRGLARAVTTALLDDLRSRGVRVVELHATAQGEGLYRSLGFTPGAHPDLRLRLDPPGA